ncbi:hypothetical protein KF707_10910 [Candidatus Obscuribacterales bacterium]|nr:hypothetical protein [Candidatus Obscuribacterales bacterium]MBX3136736.1 hypothetical protein [Candidatus Obscuribacterales bacterium]MBX3148555.1 hypothetical protein [Candidatus Obscuribacterales bacterium]
MRRRALPVILALLPVLAGEAAFAQQWNGQQFGNASGAGQQFQQNQFGQNQSQQFGQNQSQQFGQSPQQFGQQQFVQSQFQPMNSGISAQQPGVNVPMLNSQMGTMPSAPQPAQQFAPFVPGTPGEPGVDILDESLKYHNMGVQNPALSSNFNQSPQANGFSGGNQNSAAGNSNASLMSKPLFGSAGLFQTAGAPPVSTNGGGSGINSQAVGAIGAAALLGTFLTNGGVGGMIKSVGWDNSRHMRGASGF